MASSAALINTNNNGLGDTNTAKSNTALKLAPISRAECRACLKQKGVAISEPCWSPTSSNYDEYNILRNAIFLKFADVWDVDADDGDNDNVDSHDKRIIGIGIGKNNEERSHVTTYARRYRDGSIAAVALLGRNQITGIKWSVVSRALCDVSLAGGSFDGKTAEVCMLDEQPDGTKDAKSNDDATSKTVAASECAGERRSMQNQGNNYPPKQCTPTAWLSMRKSPNNHAVFLDGKVVELPIGRQVPLKDGSIISLYGPTGFAYKISIIHHDEDEDFESINCDKKEDPKINKEDNTDKSQSKKRKMQEATPHIQPQENTDNSTQSSNQEQPEPHQQLRQRAHQLMIGECTCAMCMDILVKSTFAYPCGHAFCGECTDCIAPPSQPRHTPIISTIRTTIGTNATTAAAAAIHSPPNKGMCPTCRGQVEGWMPARSFDTMVWATALQGCLDRDDAQSYLERRGKCGEDAPNDEERECILNSFSRGDADANIPEEGGGCKSTGFYLPRQLPFIQSVGLPASYSNINTSNNNAPVENMTMPSNQTILNLTTGTSKDDAICLD